MAGVQKNLPWVISFIFFAVAVAALLAPDRTQAPPPLLSREEFNTEAAKVFDPRGFDLVTSEKDGGESRGYYRYEVIYAVVDPNFINIDPYTLMNDLISVMKPETRSSGSSGNRFDSFMTNPDRFVSLEVQPMPDDRYKLVYLETVR